MKEKVKGRLVRRVTWESVGVIPHKTKVKRIRDRKEDKRKRASTKCK